MKLTCHLAVVAAALALAGCGNKNPQVGADAVKSSVQETNYMSGGRSEYLDSMDQKIKELDAGISDLGKKAQACTGDARVHADQALTALREQRSALGNRFEALKRSSGAAWGDAKAGFQAAWNNLERAYENAKSKFM